MPLIATIKTLLTTVADVFTQEYAAQQTLIRNFLTHADNARIRVFVADSSGMGHQATTVLIMNRLIALGFNQNFDVVYDNTTGATAGKLKRLIPGFNPNGTGNPQDVVINANTTASMIPLAYFKTKIADYPLVNFGITGGFDTNTTNLANTPGATDTSIGVKVNFFLKLQPFQWNKQNAIQRPGQIASAFIRLEQVAALGTASFIKRGFYVPPPVAPSQASFGDDTKYAAYQLIIGACTGGGANVNLMPVYGIGDDGGVVEANPAIRPENVLFYLIAAIRYAQRFSEVARLQRGAIIVVIATVTDTPYATLNTLLKGIADGARNTAIDNLNQFVTDVGIVAGTITANNVEIINYSGGDATWLAAKIAALQGGGGGNKILVIKMAGLPMGAFDYMYASSSLPCLLEGKGTANLVLNLNKPYFNLLKDANVVYPTLPLAAAENSAAAVQCNSAVLDFKDSAAATNTKLTATVVLDPASAGLQTTAMYKLAIVTKDAYTDGNALKTYFAGLQTFFQNQQEDKLFLSLLYFLSYVNSLEG
jgi:hypothetical protein